MAEIVCPLRSRFLISSSVAASSVPLLKCVHVRICRVDIPQGGSLKHLSTVIVLAASGGQPADDVTDEADENEAENDFDAHRFTCRRRAKWPTGFQYRRRSSVGSTRKQQRSKHGWRMQRHRNHVSIPLQSSFALTSLIILRATEIFFNGSKKLRALDLGESDALDFS